MENKFDEEKKYINLCLIASPNGYIEKGVILTGKQWTDILVYEVGNSFAQMFKIVPNEDEKE